MEFLSAVEPELANYLITIDAIEPIPDIFFNQLLDKFKMYFITGGMPEAISTMVDSGNVFTGAGRFESYSECLYARFPGAE